MYIRSRFTCNTRHGVCEKCYGKNLATGEKVEVGEAVGTIVANQSVNLVPNLQCVHSIQVV